MKTILTLGLATTWVLGAVVVTASATDPVWPQFRGPAGTGVADDQKPPTSFGPDKNVRWKVNIPAGLSCPVIVGDKLILTCFEGGKLYTLAFSRADGKELWRAEAPAAEIEPFHKTEGSPAASTPATDGERIVSYFGSCGVFCYDLAGKLLWKYELPTAQTNGDFGTGTSPIIADGLVILARDLAKDSKVLALDVKTGAKVWETPRLFPSAYSTPTVVDSDTGKEVVVPGFARMVAYDLKTGAEKWMVGGMPAVNCTVPVVGDGVLLFAGWSPGSEDFRMPTFDELLQSGDANMDGVLDLPESENTFLKGFFESNDMNKDGVITRLEWEGLLKFLSTGQNCAVAIKPGGKGDVTASHVLWRQTRGLPYVPSGVFHKGVYYLVRDGGLLTALEAKTGQPIYVTQRVGTGNYYASLIVANGHLYLSGLDGTITVVKAGTEKPEVVARNALGERISTTPAVADNVLYVRTVKHLYAFGE